MENSENIQNPGEANEDFIIGEDMTEGQIKDFNGDVVLRQIEKAQEKLKKPSDWDNLIKLHQDLKDIYETEPQNGEPFNYETEISTSDWQEMHLELGKTKKKAEESEDHNWDEFRGYASAMKILDPYVQLGIDSTVWQIPGWDISKPEDFASNVLFTKILEPEKSIIFSEESWREISKELENISGPEGNMLSFAPFYAAIKIIDDWRVNVNEAEWEKMKDTLELERGKDWDFFSGYAVTMKILNPEIDLHLDEKTWQGMKTACASYKKNKDWYGFTTLAAKMKILASKDVMEFFK